MLLNLCSDPFFCEHFCVAYAGKGDIRHILSVCSPVSYVHSVLLVRYLSHQRGAPTCTTITGRGHCARISDRNQPCPSCRREYTPLCVLQMLEALEVFWYQHYLPARHLMASHPDVDKRTLARWLHELKPGASPENIDLLQACSTEMHKSVQHVGTL